MIFVVFTEASLFAYLLFSYYYIAVQPHLPGTFPEGGTPIAGAGAAQHASSCCFPASRSRWAQFNIERNDKRHLVWGLGIARCARDDLPRRSSISNGPANRSRLASTPYSSLYFTVTGFHMAHVVVGVFMLWALFAWSAMGYFNRVRYAHIHIGALYWHFVDAVWLAVFFTFYITPLLGLR